VYSDTPNPVYAKVHDLQPSFSILSKLK